MPVSELLVEGELDSVLLRSVLDGRPPVRTGGSKNALRAKVLEERSRNQLSTASYIRDRDFDIDPPTDRSRPQVHTTANGRPLGWYWCRHEMENYLLDPGVVERALGCDAAIYGRALLDAASHICDYCAARAAIGVVRRTLPPNYDLKTRPHDIKDDALKLPEDLSAEASSVWACEQAAAFHAKICPQLETKAIEERIHRRALLAEKSLAVPSEVLVWFPGKDLLAALQHTPWFTDQKLQNAGELRARLRDWIRENPSEALDLLPEWQRFIGMLNEP